MAVIATCPACSTKNKLPAAPRARCGKCKREFTSHEMLAAAIGAKAGPTPTRDVLTSQGGDEGEMLTCPNADCGWEGDVDDAEEDPRGKDTHVACPECGKRIKLPDEDEE